MWPVLVADNNINKQQMFYPSYSWYNKISNEGLSSKRRILSYRSGSE